jgi:iron(II)-dependent oxidoreductase
MAGNVSEWVSSLFKPYPYDANDGRENMSSSSDRIARGGSQNDHMYYGYYYNSSERYKNYPPSFIGLIGIRCARSP